MSYDVTLKGFVINSKRCKVSPEVVKYQPLTVGHVDVALNLRLSQEFVVDVRDVTTVRIQGLETNKTTSISQITFDKYTHTRYI